MDDPANGRSGFASLYRLPHVLVVVTGDRTTAGFYIDTDRVTKAPIDTDPDVLGGLLLAALAASRDKRSRAGPERAAA